MCVRVHVCVYVFVLVCVCVRVRVRVRALQVSKGEETAVFRCHRSGGQSSSRMAVVSAYKGIGAVLC